MSLSVLESASQIRVARKDLKKSGLSTLDSPLVALMRRVGLVRGVRIGDRVKSWDVQRTLQFLERNVTREMPILDIGCYASELIIALHRRRYTRLAGADFDADLSRMPYQGLIRYEVCNFMHTKFADCSFEAVTAISVIEHGFDGPSLFAEVSRVLRPGGYFIASFDYWPEKIDTSGKELFGVDWKIFSKEEVGDMIVLAASYNLVPVGDLSFEAKDPVINFEGRQYTFGWLVLKKQGHA
ncbi:MAG: class I SAM-dependent methyltransferase [Gemmatimonadaceae bacterium]